MHLSMTVMYIHAEPRVHAWGPQTKELCALLFSPPYFLEIRSLSELEAHGCFG